MVPLLTSRRYYSQSQNTRHVATDATRPGYTINSYVLRFANESRSRFLAFIFLHPLFISFFFTSHFPLQMILSFTLYLVCFTWIVLVSDSRLFDSHSRVYSHVLTVSPFPLVTNNLQLPRQLLSDVSLSRQLEASFQRDESILLHRMCSPLSFWRNLDVSKDTPYQNATNHEPTLQVWLALLRYSGGM